MPKLTGPVYVAPAVGSQDDRLVVLVRGAEVWYLPDATFKYLLPVVSLMDFTSYFDAFYNKTFFFGERGVDGGKGVFFNYLFLVWCWVLGLRES